MWDPWWGPGWGFGWGPSYGWYDPWWNWPPPYYTYPYPIDFPGSWGAPYDSTPSNDNYNNNDNNGNDDSLYGPYSSNGYTGMHQSTPFALGTPVTNPVTANVAISAPTVLVYLKDGTMLAANEYWLADGQFHYTVKYGGENVIGMDQVDVQKSIDENLKRGVKFTLKARPAMASGGGSGDAFGAEVDAGRCVKRRSRGATTELESAGAMSDAAGRAILI